MKKKSECASWALALAILFGVTLGLDGFGPHLARRAPPQEYVSVE
jgi:hypothetical protein